MKQIVIALLTFISLSANAQNKVVIRGTTGGGGGGSITVDQTLIDGSPNAVANNAVYDGLDLKMGRGNGQAWSRPNASFMIPASIGPTKPIELFNIGAIVSPANAFQLVPTGIGKIACSMEQTWNVTLDSSSIRWLKADNIHPQHIFEVGLEGITLHAVPPAINFSDTWHEQFQVRATGVDGTAGITSGVFNQSKTTMYWKYKSGTYGSDDSHPWTGGSSTADNPFIWLHSEEPKGTTGEYLRFEQNSGSVSGPQVYFKKSRGSYASKAASSSGDLPGLINFSTYDGSAYQNTSRIITQMDATATAGVAPQSLIFQTSATNTAGLATRMQIKGDGTIVYPGLAGTGTRGLGVNADGDLVIHNETGGGGITDGDKGDITVSGSGATWTIDNLAVTDAKINSVAASKVTLTQDQIPYASASGTLTGSNNLKFNGATLSVANTGNNALVDLSAPGATGATVLNINAPAITTGVAVNMTAPLSTDLGSGKVFQIKAGSESFGRGMFYSDGSYGIGPGTAGRDVFLSRPSANTFRISSDRGTGAGNLEVTGWAGTGDRLLAADANGKGKTIANITYTGSQLKHTGSTFLNGAVYNKVQTFAGGGGGSPIDDTNSYINIDASSAGSEYALLLPDVTTGGGLGKSGLRYVIKKVDNSAIPVIIYPNGSQTIEGAASKTLATQYKTIILYTDGSGWFIEWSN